MWERREEGRAKEMRRHEVRKRGRREERERKGDKKTRDEEERALGEERRWERGKGDVERK